jgi:hypothetical protein
MEWQSALQASQPARLCLESRRLAADRPLLSVLPLCLACAVTLCLSRFFLDGDMLTKCLQRAQTTGGNQKTPAGKLKEERKQSMPTHAENAHKPHECDPILTGAHLATVSQIQKQLMLELLSCRSLLTMALSFTERFVHEYPFSFCFHGKHAAKMILKMTQCPHEQIFLSAKHTFLYHISY